jgi:hypothetical protein
MNKVSRIVTLSSVMLLTCASARADIDLQYIGAFRPLANNAGVYGGDLTFNPAGDGGAGSLYVSRGSAGTSKEVYEVTIPALVITTDVNALNVATTIRSFDTTIAPIGMSIRSTDGLLYYCTGASGSGQSSWRFCNLDGTAESTNRLSPAWSSSGWGLCEIPADWANTYAGGKNLITVGNFYGARINAADPWNDPVTWTTLVGYDGSHLMTDYDYYDQMIAIEWVSVAGEANVVIGGKDNSVPAANLWFYRAADVQNPAQIYTPQPYKTLAVQDKMLVTGNTTIHGLAYDAAHSILYAYEGAYQLPTVVHAWQVLDNPPTAVTDLGAATADWFAVTLTWTAPSDDHGADGAAAIYDVRYSTAAIDDTNWASASQCTGEPVPATPGASESFTVTGLQANTQYYFALKAADANGHASALSNVPVATTNPLDIVAPAAITNLAFSAVKPNRVTLSWTAVGDDGTTGQANRYEIRYATSPLDESSWSSATVATGVPAPQASGSSETFVLRGLDPSTTYYVAIKAADEVPNWAAISNVVTFTTPVVDVTPPTTITDLAVAATHIHAAYLTWTAPADIGTAGIGDYDVRYSTSAIDDANWDSATQCTGEPTPSAPGTLERFTVTGLAADTTYYFAIKTSDLAEPANVSALSNVPSGKTLPPIIPLVIHNPWIVNDRVADTHNLASMGATYVNAYTPNGVVAPASDEDKAINIYNNQKRRLYHWGDEPPNTTNGSISDPVYTQNIFGWCLCGRHASQACTIANAAGLVPRQVGLPGHWVYEIKYADGTYHLYDTMTTMYLYNRATPRKVASCAEISADNSLMLNAVAEGRACPGFLLCGDTPEWYADALNHNSPGADGSGVVASNWSMNMDVRMGEAFLRTWESWLNQHQTPKINADSAPGNDPPYHHEANKDWKDTVNILYWEPYQLTPAQSSALNIPMSPTYRRWANGTDTLAPDFRSAGYQASLAASSGIATFNDDSLTPDLHVATPGTTATAVFKINVPFHITDATISGDFVRTSVSDVTRIYFSKDNAAWTQVWDNMNLGTTHLSNLSLRSNIFGANSYGIWGSYWIKIELKGTAAKTDAGVSDLIIQTTFQHNKGAMAYLDKGVNHITVTFDNPEDLGPGAAFKVTYKWKEYDGAGWNTDRIHEQYITGSPTAFTITASGTKVPRTEYILLEVAEPPPPDLYAPAAVSDLAAGTAGPNKVPLTWTATGDDDLIGQATSYDLRYSTAPITTENFDIATVVAGLPAPQPSGTAESFTVRDLTPDTLYYFAIKVRDEGGNLSGLSNVAIAQTAPADLTPPRWVGDLVGKPSATGGGVDLTWTAPADYGANNSGPFSAASYDLRYSTSPITEANWASATPVGGLPAPGSPGSAEAFTATGLTGGTQLYFAIKAADESGNVSEISNVAPAKASVIGEKVLQYGLNGYTGTRDSYVDASSTTANYGTYERMTLCGYASSDPGNRQRGLVRFDLAGLSSSATLTNATLYLYAYDVAGVRGSTGFYGAYPVSRDWADSSVTWNNASTGVAWTTPGGDFPGAPDATAPKQAVALVWYAWNVTARVQAWLASPASNYGWVMKCTDENLNNQDRFYQSDTANATYRPKLVVTDLVAPVAGDINGDGAVDVADLLILAYSFGGAVGVDRNYDPRADLNADGVVDVSDLLILAMHWPP